MTLLLGMFYRYCLKPVFYSLYRPDESHVSRMPTVYQEETHPTVFPARVTELASGVESTRLVGYNTVRNNLGRNNWLDIQPILEMSECETRMRGQIVSGATIPLFRSKLYMNTQIKVIIYTADSRAISALIPKSVNFKHDHVSFSA
jgi:hypothetical protein